MAPRKVSESNVINVKNASGDPDTTAKIIVQNNIDYTPAVSVIMPVYNGERYLRECLDSVVNQTLKNIEIICVDDGSTDGSLSILREYASQDPRITILAQENLHAGVARNAGLSVARGEYLSFLDCDDFFELDMLAETYAHAKSTNTDIVMFNAYLFDDVEKEDKRVDYTLKVNALPEIFNFQNAPETIFQLSNCWVWNRLYKHDFVTKNNLFFQNIAFSNDVFFSCMTMVLAKNISSIDKYFVHYRTNQIQNTNITSNTGRLKEPTASLQCFVKLKQELVARGLYKHVEKSYITACVENLYWTSICMRTNAKAFDQFVSYFASNYQEIFVAPSVDLLIKNANEKYVRLRNILVDYGVFDEIPKRIFYVWGANEPKRPEVQKCINTWKEFLPDYEIVELNEENKEYFDYDHELKTNRWFRTVYTRKMWAYVADYIRMRALYDNGGIYFDTDVSVVQNMDKFLQEPAFVGMQMSSQDGTGDWVEPAICGAKKHNDFIGKVVSFYDELIWQEPIYTMPHLFNYYLRKYDIFPFPKKEDQEIIKLPDITIYPEKYFIPYRFRSEYSPECIQPETHTVHWWGGSWTKPEILYFLNNKHLTMLPGDNLPVLEYPVTASVQTKKKWFQKKAKDSTKKCELNQFGNYVSFPEKMGLKLKIHGKNNTIIIDKNIDKSKKIYISLVGNNNFIRIGAGSAEISLHMGFEAYNRNVNYCDFVFGNGNQSHMASYFIEEDHTSISVGDNNLFSWGLEFRCSDSHTLLDENGRVSNLAKSIVIGDNNWICKDTLFLKNSKIPNGCVVGCRSTVTKQFEEDKSMIVGNPASVVKHNIGWNVFKPDTYERHFATNTPAEPKVSVIIPVYNVARYLPQCLDSVINQTFKNLEIICINDGSTDNSLQILQDYAKRDSRITIIDQKNQGLSASRNNALDIAKGRYVLFLDSDDWLREDACELLYTKAVLNNIDMLNFAGTNYFEDTKQCQQMSFQTMDYTGTQVSVFNRSELEKFIENIPISACRFFYKREFLDKHSMRFPKNLNFEDNYFVNKALLFVKCFATEKEVLYFRRVHSQSITQNEHKFFGHYIGIVSKISEMFIENNAPADYATKIISKYCKNIYCKYTSMHPMYSGKYRKQLFEMLLNMQQTHGFYNFDYYDAPDAYAKELKTWWFQRKHKKLNLSNPKTFNEKIQWLKLYDSTPIKTRLADKYLVRDWVAEKIGEQYLIPLLGVYDKFEEIDFDKLPDRFVIKCNHGCAYNIIVKDKSKLDLNDVKAKLDKWMAEDYAFKCGLELHYRDIPHKIIIEQFVTNDNKALWDYKFWCFGGRVHYMQFRDDFSSDLKMVFYDTNWKKQSFYYDHPLYEKDLEKPDNFDEMLSIAEKLCQGFEFVCVDLYRLNNGEIKFGEMTFTRTSGVGNWNDEKINRYFGNLIKLPRMAYNIDTGEYYPVPHRNHLKSYLLFPWYLVKLAKMRKKLKQAI